MKRMYEIVPTASGAVLAMCDGLLEQSQRPDFHVVMHSFGESDGDGTCYGCAATCAIQQATGINLPSNQYFMDRADRANLWHLDKGDVERFEKAIDELRVTNVRKLLNYYQGHCDYDYRDFRISARLRLQSLDSTGWRQNLGAYRKLADQLKSFESQQTERAKQ